MNNQHKQLDMKKVGGAIAVVALIIAAGLYFFWPSSGGNTTADGTTQNSEVLPEGTKIYTFAVVDWPGYLAGQTPNNGFSPTTNSEYFRLSSERGHPFAVRFQIINDLNSSRAAFLSGDVDFLWATAGSFSTESEQLDAEMVIQADWSRGGDAIVAVSGINDIKDLKGKKIACAELSPSHTFLIKTLNLAGLTMNDVDARLTSDAIEASKLFQSGEVDVAVVWSPDDQICAEEVQGSSILFSTKKAPYIIADGFLAKNSFVNANRDELITLFEVWMRSAEKLNDPNNEQYRLDAAQILVNEFESYTTLEQARSSMDNVYYTTIGDNLNFFGLNRSFEGVTGEDLYSTMTSEYSNIDVVNPNDVPDWREVSNSSIITRVAENIQGSNTTAETAPTFTKPSPELANVEPIASKSVQIYFETGSAELSPSSKKIIDMSYGESAKMYANNRIKIVGNTDDTGNEDFNTRLSQRRAESVVNYMVNRYKYDRNRFVIVGNGPKKARRDGVTGSNENYRTTDFELIVE